MVYIIGSQEVEAVKEAITNNAFDRYIHGEDSITCKTERKISQLFNAKHALAVSSGTAALICGLVGGGIGPGDEVIIPSFTYIATALAVLAVGAVPVIAEIDNSLTIDPRDVARKITPYTKAIIPVHMHGLPCNMTAIKSLADKFGLFILEDVAQACGGYYQGKRLGTIGDAGIFSFNHHKIITCGEGGALVTNKDGVYQRALLQQHGGCIYEPVPPQLSAEIFAGNNYRISEIASAILNVQLNRLDGILSALREDKLQIIELLSATHLPFSLSPVNDPEGECGTRIFFSFSSPEQTTRFLEKAKQLSLDIWSPLTKGHVYSTWTPVLQQVGSHAPALDGFKLAKRGFQLSEDMLPASLNILKSTLALSTKIQREKNERESIVTKLIECYKAGG